MLYLMREQCFTRSHFYASTTKYFLLYAHVIWMYNLGQLFRVKFLIFRIVLYPITPHPFLIILCVVAHINSVTEKGKRKSNRKFLPDGENWNITLVSLPAQIHFFDKLEMIYGEKMYLHWQRCLSTAIQCSHFYLLCIWLLMRLKETV